MNYDDIDNYYVPWYFWLPYKICQLLSATFWELCVGLFKLMGKMEIYEKDEMEKYKLDLYDIHFIERLKRHKDDYEKSLDKK